MRTGPGKLTQINLGLESAGQIACPQALIPAPGQYLMALAETDRASALATPVFPAGYFSGGFLAAPRLPETWLPGTSLLLRGPLGKGFSLPSDARRVALVALADTSARLVPLIRLALHQGAAVLLVVDSSPESLPSDVEVMPLSSLGEAVAWADYLALDLPREALSDTTVRGTAGQALVRTPMPCGGMADCGACAIHVRRGSLLACKDGPVLDLKKVF